MANYKEYKTDLQKVTNIIGFTFDTLSKIPVVAKRIWGTLADAQAWVDDNTQTAIAGLVLTVINDGVNNGVYFVKSIGDGTNAGVLEKLSLSEATSDVQKALSDLTSALGAASTSTLTEALKDSNYLSASTVDSVSDALVALDSALKATNDAIPTSASQLVNDANYATSGYVDSKAEEASGAVQSWVEEQNYITGVDLSNYALSADVHTEVADAIVTASGAAQTWVEQQNYITGVDLSNYATTGYVDNKAVEASGSVKAWVEEQKYISGVDLSDYATTGYVNQQDQALSGVVTGWVEEQKYALSADVNTEIADAIVTASGAAQTWVKEQKFLQESDLSDYLKGASVNGQEISTTNSAITLDGGDVKVGDYTAVEFNTAFTSHTSVTSAQTIAEALNAVESTMSGIVDEMIANEEVAATGITALATALGISEGEAIAYVAPTTATYISGATSYSDADAKLDSAIKALADELATLDGDAIKSVEAADNTVTVAGTSAKTISVNSQNLDIVGADAITVTKQSDNTGLDVKLKLATAPASGESGVVLAQDSDGLSATIQWGTF